MTPPPPAGLPKLLTTIIHFKLITSWPDNALVWLEISYCFFFYFILGGQLHCRCSTNIVAVLVLGSFCLFHIKFTILCSRAFFVLGGEVGGGVVITFLVYFIYSVRVSIAYYLVQLIWVQLTLYRGDLMDIKTFKMADDLSLLLAAELFYKWG